MDYSDNGYYERYEELQEIVLNGYVDVFILDELEQYNKSLLDHNTALPRDSFLCLNHIAGLCRDDLGMSIIKLFEDGKSNTIKTLKTVICEELKTKDIVIDIRKIKLDCEQQDVFERIKHIRNKRVAHNDKNKTDIEVDLFEMKSLLNEMRVMLNGMCIPELDSRVIQITESALEKLKFQITLGEGFMIERSRF